MFPSKTSLFPLVKAVWSSHGIYPPPNIWGGANFFFFVILLGAERISKFWGDLHCWGDLSVSGGPRRVSTNQFNLKFCCKKKLNMFAFNQCLTFTNTSIMLIVTNIQHIGNVYTYTIHEGLSDWVRCVFGGTNVRFRSGGTCHFGVPDFCWGDLWPL